MMIDRLSLSKSSSVVEVASNDGYLLQYFRQAGINVLGIEPSASVARVARDERHIPTIERFFGRQSALEIAESHGKADLIIANNVLAHVPDINDFVAGFDVLLQDDGVATFEFPHVLNLLDQVQFDTIYHEHFSYLSLLACEPIFKRAGLRIFDVAELSTHGGSLRLFACKQNSTHRDHKSVDQIRAKEKLHQLDQDFPYEKFMTKIHTAKWSLLSLLITQKQLGKKIAAYGAAAKGNTLLNFCGIRSDLVDYVVDQSPFKQGKYLPGTHLPVLKPEYIFDDRPDLLLILPWNLQSEIVDLMAGIRSWGGRFIVPIPSATILE
jgi:SAM-dependent methyltransferase